MHIQIHTLQLLLAQRHSRGRVEFIRPGGAVARAQHERDTGTALDESTSSTRCCLLHRATGLEAQKQTKSRRPAAPLPTV